MAGWLNEVFGLVCGQVVEHTWSPGGLFLPLCERCTGLYGGAAVALSLHLALRIRPHARFLQTHGGFLLLMIPLGYHWVPQDAVVRTLSGALFGAGLVCFLRLIPGPRAVATRAMDGAQSFRYTTGIVAALIGLPASAAWGGRPAWYALACLATAGLAGLGALTMASVGRVSMSVWQKVCCAASPTTSIATHAPADAVAAAGADSP